MELVQSHERGWGTEQYAGRPTLSDLLSRPVVVFWTDTDKKGQGRYIISVHEQLEELNSILLNMILASKVAPSSNRRLSRIFVKQKPVMVKGVKLIVTEGDSK